MLGYPAAGDEAGWIKRGSFLDVESRGVYIQRISVDMIDLGLITSTKRKEIFGNESMDKDIGNYTLW